MSYVIKAFGVINKALDTVLGNTAGIGELSPYSRTFSTHKTNLAKNAYPHASAVVFSCEQDEVDALVPPNAEIHLLDVLNIIASQFESDIPFEEQFNSRFPTIAPTLYFDATTQYQGIELPGYVQWKATLYGEIITFKVWLSDLEFRKSFDEYEIRVIPPVPNVADLLQERAVVEDALRYYTDAQKFEAIGAAKGDDPETKLVPLTLRWVDQSTGAVIPLTWLLVVYGPKGLLYENQIEAVRDYLRDQTGTIPDEWEDIIPELNVSTVLNIVPLWHKVALRATGSIHYYHSLTLQQHEFAEVQAVRLGGPADELTVSRTYLSATPYKGIAFMATPDSKTPMDVNFHSLYPDYALIPLMDININRLKVDTRDAIKAIERGIRMAEIYIDGMELSDPFHVQREGDLTYICYNVNGITHRVATRESFLQAINND